jgi:branched-chain amino acid transport system ATP-binding protein
MLLLQVEDLSVDFGRVTALKSVSLAVREGQIATVLGANGAGKSTLLRAIMGAVRPSAGLIRFGGQDVTREPVHARMASGLTLVPEGRRILITLTIEENLLLGAHLRRDAAGITRDMTAIYDRFPNLAARRHMGASCLSGGEQQMLAIGRAMMARPKVMMLDEPSLGLSPLFVQHIFEIVRRLNTEGLTVLLVEQNLMLTMKHASRCYVLERGRVVVSGSADAVKEDPRTRRAYLGL